MMQLIRPPPSPLEGSPLHPLPRLTASGHQPVLRIKHPDYPPSLDVLLSIPAFDPLPSQPDPPSLSSPPTAQAETVAEDVEASVGLHHGTVLTICGIIADNIFDVYLSYDREGARRVDWHYDSILPAGEYWAHVPRPSSTPVEAGQQQTHESASAAPLREEHNTTARRQTPYPIVPNFENWRFPHGRLPALWRKDHEPPLSAPHQGTPSPTSTSKSIAQRLRALQPMMRSCAISAHHSGLEIAHLVHARCKDWFLDNDMAQYGDTTAILPTDQPFNKIALRADLHTIFDSAHLTIVPKPVYITPPLLTSTSTSNPTSTSTSTSASTSTSSITPASQARYALAVHILDARRAQLELVPLYHNQALCFQDIGNEFERQYKSSREYLFARFAWSIFPLLRTFLEKKRLVAIRVKGQQSNTSAAAALSSDTAACEYKWENNASLTPQSRSISRKRSAPQISQAKNSAEYDITDEELFGPIWCKRRRSSSPVVFELDEDSERLIDWATRRREAAAESDLLPELYPDVGGDDIPRGRRRRRHGENTGSSNSPRGSVPDLSVSIESSSSAFPEHGRYNDGAGGNGLSIRDEMPTKGSLSSAGDIILQEDVDSI
jgi:hypothetical protein